MLKKIYVALFTAILVLSSIIQNHTLSTLDAQSNHFIFCETRDDFGDLRL